MAKLRKTSLGRRGFLKNAAAGAAGAAALVTTTMPLVEAQTQGSARGAATPTAPAPTEAQLEREAGYTGTAAAVRTFPRPGSYLRVQVLRDLGIEYAAANPGSSFEGFQESVIN